MKLDIIAYNFRKIMNSHCAKLYVTRAPRGTDRSPEYNELFCQKLDFLANQKA